METVTLLEAKQLIQSMAHEQSLLLVSPPGVGKSDVVRQAADEAGLTCRSLLGTQIAPEDVSGVPRIVGERSVFCPPRVLLPENAEPFCLFLDELPACAPDVQKAFYSLLLERRLGEHELPAGSWVVAAGNRAHDRALVRAVSSALVNRLFVVNVRVDAREWLIWARTAGVRSEILAFITYVPAALMRPVPREPEPFSTPAPGRRFRARSTWPSAGALNAANRRALAFGRLSAHDAALFCADGGGGTSRRAPRRRLLRDPALLPEQDTARWFVIHRVRSMVQEHTLPSTEPAQVDAFFEIAAAGVPIRASGRSRRRLGSAGCVARNVRGDEGGDRPVSDQPRDPVIDDALAALDAGPSPGLREPAASCRTGATGPARGKPAHGRRRGRLVGATRCEPGRLCRAAAGRCGLCPGARAFAPGPRHSRQDGGLELRPAPLQLRPRLRHQRYPGRGARPRAAAGRSRRPGSASLFTRTTRRRALRRSRPPELLVHGHRSRWERSVCLNPAGRPRLCHGRSATRD